MVYRAICEERGSMCGADDRLEGGEEVGLAQGFLEQPKYVTDAVGIQTRTVKAPERPSVSEEFLFEA